MWPISVFVVFVVDIIHQDGRDRVVLIALCFYFSRTARKRTSTGQTSLAMAKLRYFILTASLPAIAMHATSRRSPANIFSQVVGIICTLYAYDVHEESAMHESLFVYSTSYMPISKLNTMHKYIPTLGIMQKCVHSCTGGSNIRGGKNHCCVATRTFCTCMILHDSNKYHVSVTKDHIPVIIFIISIVYPVSQIISLAKQHRQPNQHSKSLACQVNGFLPSLAINHR